MKDKFIPIATVILLLIAGYLFLNKSNGTLSKSYNDFHIEDTASITKIFLADKNKHTIKLEKINNQWILNDSLKPREDYLNLLLATFYQIRPNNVVPKNALPHVFENMNSTSGVKIEIYQKGAISKTFYIGSDTPQWDGTYMLIEGSEKPYEVHIPGFRGFLSPRFSVLQAEWKSTNLFSLSAKNINKIEFKNNNYPEESFILERTNSDSLYLFNNQSQKVFLNLVEGWKYLDNFKNIHYEYETIMRATKKDTILSKQPFFNLKITTNQNNVIYIDGFQLLSEAEVKNALPDAIKSNIDRFYALINHQDLYFMQYYHFKNILTTKSALTMPVK